MSPIPLMMNKSTQVSNFRAHFRSKGVSCEILSNCTASTSIANVKRVVNSANSSIKFENKTTYHNSNTTMTTTTTTTFTSATDPTVSEYHRVAPV